MHIRPTDSELNSPQVTACLRRGMYRVTLLIFSQRGDNKSTTARYRNIVTIKHQHWMWPIWWRQYRWPWVTFRITLDVWNLLDFHAAENVAYIDEISRVFTSVMFNVILCSAVCSRTFYAVALWFRRFIQQYRVLRLVVMIKQNRSRAIAIICFQ